MDHDTDERGERARRRAFRRPANVLPLMEPAGDLLRAPSGSLTTKPVTGRFDRLNALANATWRRVGKTAATARPIPLQHGEANVPTYGS